MYNVAPHSTFRSLEILSEIQKIEQPHEEN